jgi:hypothetical protein
VKEWTFGPRVGFAYDLFGSGRTLLRGGYGVFNFHDAQGPYSGFIDLPYGVTFTNATNVRLSQVPSVNPNTQPSIGASLAIDDDSLPRTQSWSVTVHQRLPYQMTLEAGYVGSKSDNLLTTGEDTANINTVPFGAMLADPTGNPNNYRPLRQYGNLVVHRHSLYQNYNSLQALLSRASSKFSYTIAYTWSKALGIRGGGTGQQGQVSALPTDIRGTAYGVLGYDRTHVLNVGYSYLLPELEGSALKKAFLSGWQLTGVSTYISGGPLQALTSTGANFGVTGTLPGGAEITNTRVLGTNAVAVMPVLTCDPREGVNGDQLVNPDCFALPGIGSNGNYIFPTLRGPGYINHDFAVFKNFAMGGSRKFQFRASLTNVFNHPQRFLDENVNLNLDYTNGVMTNSQFGVLPRDNKYGRRIVQLAFKYYF